METPFQRGESNKPLAGSPEGAYPERDGSYAAAHRRRERDQPYYSRTFTIAFRPCPLPRVVGKPGETKEMQTSELIIQRLKELQRERQAKIEKALRNAYRPGFTRQGRLCLVKKDKGDA